MMLGTGEAEPSIYIVIPFHMAVKPAAPLQWNTKWVCSVLPLLAQRIGHATYLWKEKEDRRSPGWHTANLQDSWGVNRNKHWETPKPQRPNPGRIISTDFKLNTEPVSFLPAANHCHDSRSIKRSPNGHPNPTHQPPFSWVDIVFYKNWHEVFFSPFTLPFSCRAWNKSSTQEGETHTLLKY